MSKTHTLKVWPHWYDEISTGRKTFEIRDGNDRCFQSGDMLQLQRWDPQRREFTPASPPIYVRVMAVYNQPGLAPGYVAMSIRRESDSGPLDPAQR